ncbi:hypothetical protein PHLCEN_2v10011 [Hermanssonia centrifuga]|uniref:Uncharacterized protein n=1 Tax=Hermanssonia centrifuga TaxID=98765 RepID=A0A2R6NP74_9APHY|nr:hypothetical protein PHLCEN_2v10011 [Hermanssonia centrifuga]
MAPEARYTLFKESEAPASPVGWQRRTARERIIFSVSIILGLAAFSFLWAFSPSVLGLTQLQDESSSSTGYQNSLSAPLKQCASSLPPPANPPASVNIWASLSVPETVAITEWLSHPLRNLNVTSADRASLSDNIIFLVEAYRPSKADALAYLSAPVSENLPARYARATVHLGARQDEDGGPVIKDYLVGPLPLGDETSMRELTEIYHRNEIPYNARSFVIPSELTPLLVKIMPPLAEVTKDLFGGVAMGLPNDTLVAGASGPLSFDGSFRRTWISWRRNLPGPWLHPVNFFQYVDFSGTDPEQWKLIKVAKLILYPSDYFDVAFCRSSIIIRSSLTLSLSSKPTTTALSESYPHVPIKLPIPSGRLVFVRMPLQHAI